MGNFPGSPQPLRLISLMQSLRMSSEMKAYAHSCPTSRGLSPLSFEIIVVAESPNFALGSDPTHQRALTPL